LLKPADATESAESDIIYLICDTSLQFAGQLLTSESRSHTEFSISR